MWGLKTQIQLSQISLITSLSLPSSSCLAEYHAHPPPPPDLCRQQWGGGHHYYTVRPSPYWYAYSSPFSRPRQYVGNLRGQPVFRRPIRYTSIMFGCVGGHRRDEWTLNSLIDLSFGTHPCLFFSMEKGRNRYPSRGVSFHGVAGPGCHSEEKESVLETKSVFRNRYKVMTRSVTWGRGRFGKVVGEGTGCHSGREEGDRLSVSLVVTHVGNGGYTLYRVSLR
jgi:hypothetical protein